MAYDDLTSTSITLEAFLVRLARHDWFHQFSDDPGVYRLGCDEQSELERMARQSPEHENLFRAFEAHVMDGAAKPELLVAAPVAADPVTAADLVQPGRDPELVALTDPQLADDLGTANEIAKRSTARLEKLKAECKARGITLATGALYIVTVTSSSRTSLDTSAVKRDMPPAWIAAHSKTTTSTTVNIKTR